MSVNIRPRGLAPKGLKDSAQGFNPGSGFDNRCALKVALGWCRSAELSRITIRGHLLAPPSGRVLSELPTQG
jgi:hypothetical protein